MTPTRTSTVAKDSEPARSARTAPLLWMPLALVALAAIAYIPSFSGAFLLDDTHAIVENPRLRTWSNLHRRRPAVNVTLAINYALGGLNPAGYHAVNLGVHLCASLLLFGVVRRIAVRTVAGGAQSAGAATSDSLARGDPASSRAGDAATVAFAVALLWAVHPLCTQAVTYVIQRAESLCAMFMLLSIYALLRAVEDGRAAWLVLGAIAGAAANGCKATAVVLPVVVYIIDAQFVARSSIDPLRKRWWFYAALVAGVGVLAVSGVLRGVLSTTPRTFATVGFGYDGATPIEYLLTQSEVILRYLRLSVWPIGQCFLYEWDFATSVSEVWAALAIVGALLLLSAAGFLARRWWGAVALLFFVLLAPTSSIVPIRDPIFEHRMYLPLACIVALIVVSAMRWRPAGSQTLRSATDRRPALCVVLALGALLGSLTWHRNTIYASPQKMWEDVAEKQPRCARAWRGLAAVATEEKRFANAREHLTRALTINPYESRAYGALGKLFLLQGQPREAVGAYRRAIDLEPNYFAGRSDLAAALAQVGKIDEAERLLQELLEIRPKMANAWCNLGNVRYLQRRPEQAKAAYERALEIDAEHAFAKEGIERLRALRPAP